MGTVGLTDGDLPRSLRPGPPLASQGLSIVHTNRLLRRLSEDGLVTVQGRLLRILDQRRLEAFADFSPAI